MVKATISILTSIFILNVTISWDIYGISVWISASSNDQWLIQFITGSYYSYIVLLHIIHGYLWLLPVVMING